MTQTELDKAMNAMRNNRYAKRVSAVIIRAGQAAPYEDSIYEGYLMYESTSTRGGGEVATNEWRPVCTIVKADAQRFIYAFPDKPEGMDAQVEIFEEIAEGIWHVRVRIPYNEQSNVYAWVDTR